MKRVAVVLFAIASAACGNEVRGPAFESSTPANGDAPDVLPPLVPTPDEPEAPRRVAMLIAQGHMGRTTVSCDGGRHWLGERSFDEGKYVCWTNGHPNNVECDHDPGAGRGLGASGGAFVANFGWGTPATFHRSTNGFDWEQKHTFRSGLEGVNPTGDGFIMVASTSVSRDDGLTWEDIRGTNTSGVDIGHTRRSAYLPTHDMFILIGDNGALISTDRGVTWRAPSTWPAVCHDGHVGVGSDAERIVVATSGGILCTSTDAGETFATSTLDTNPVLLLMAGGRFHMWSATLHLTSDDALTWQSATITPAGVSIGATAYDPHHKTFASVRGGWDRWYANQRFYVSENGTDWQELPETDAVRGHPIRNMQFGYVDPSEHCAGEPIPSE